MSFFHIYLYRLESNHHILIARKVKIFGTVLKVE